MSKVVVLGASEKPERYAYQAVKLLEEKGYEALPINPKLKEIEGIKVYENIEEIAKQFPGKIDTLSIYVNPQISTSLEKEILNLKPRRIIFNPGAENDALKKIAEQNGIKTQEACTLVLLRTKQFDLN